MKKSSIFKILTFFLTFVIFSCCSGCLTLISYTHKKDVKEDIQEQKQKKALADALVPEIEGYTFEALLQFAVDNPEDIEKQGFLYYWDFMKEEYACVKENNSENIEEYWVYPSMIDIQSRTKADSLGYVIPSEYHKKIFEVFPESFSYPVIEYNDKYFYLSQMSFSLKSSKSGAGALALFLLDFENHRMYYVGYSKGWLEYEIAHGKFYKATQCYYRITKE